MKEIKGLNDFFEDVFNRRKFQSQNDLNFQNDDINLHFSSFLTSSGFAYNKSDIVCNDFLIHSHKDITDYVFVTFNVGINALKLIAGGDKFILHPNEFCVGTLRRKLKVTHEFENKRYFMHSFSITEPMLMREIGAWAGLDFEADISLRHFKANTAQRLILRDLCFANNFCGKMREIFIESKIMEMIYRSFGYGDFSKFSESAFRNRKLEEENFGVLLNALVLEKSAVKNEEYEPVLQKARHTILSNLKNPPSIKKLARICATNEFKLKSAFKERFGATIYAYVANERLNLAKELLSRGDICVKEAASAVGYASQAHFAKIFYAKFGILPKEFSKG